MSSAPNGYEEYHPGSIHLDGWDYRRSAWYFLTICTQDRHPYFGTVRNGIVGLSRAGCIAAQEWRRTPEVRPYVRLDAWVVMPNHVHGILGITTESPAHDAAKSLDRPDVDSSRRDESTHENRQESMDEFDYTPIRWGPSSGNTNRCAPNASGPSVVPISGSSPGITIAFSATIAN